MDFTDGFIINLSRACRAYKSEASVEGPAPTSNGQASNIERDVTVPQLPLKVSIRKSEQHGPKGQVFDALSTGIRSPPNVAVLQAQDTSAASISVSNGGQLSPDEVRASTKPTWPQKKGVAVKVSHHDVAYRIVWTVS